ncbi:MAG: YdeI/OmpD-associated family protein [Candidatus Acidiferrales bacterium]
MAGKSNPRRFLATIYKVWLMRHVDVPEEIGRALERESGKKNHIPVVAIVNGKPARVTLVPAGGGRYRLHLNTALRKAARADAGEVVSVELRLDRGSRSLPVPPDLSAGLKRHPKAWRAFQDLAPGHRRHFIQWFDSAKSPAARQRRLDRAVDALLERALLRSPARSGRRKSRSAFP